MSKDALIQQKIDANMAALDKLRGYTGDDEVVSLKELSKTLGDKKQFSFNSGFKSLDDLLKGFEAGELIVISGPTKCGKTTYAQALTSNLSAQGVKSLWFSFEMPLRQFILGFKDIPEIVYVPKRIDSSTFLWLKNKILEAILKFGIRAVFIDHLGFLSDMATKQDRRIEIDTIVRAIKTIAKELDITIFLVHHITKIEAGTRPGYENLKESSAVAQDCDKVLMIWRDFRKLTRRELEGRKRSEEDTSEIEYTGLTKLSIELDRREGLYKKVLTLRYVRENKEFVEEGKPEPLVDVASAFGYKD